MRHVVLCGLLGLGMFWPWGSLAAADDPPDLILHHGKIVTVDPQFHVAQALAVRGERIAAVGANEAILQRAGPHTRRVDLHGKTVLPGLIDSHLHIVSSAMYEFDHEVPDMQSIADVLAHVRQRAHALGPDQWIVISQVFITRLRERRYPTRQELDAAAPRNPVAFCTGPDASLNSQALAACGIDKHFEIRDGQAGRVERDAAGKPTGILRNCRRFIKSKPTGRTATAEDQRQRVKALLAAYNAVGLTSVSDRNTSDEDLAILSSLHQRHELTCRLFLTYALNAQLPWDQIEARVQAAAAHQLHRHNYRLWLRGMKIFLDGGMLTGSAYMLQPWGVSTMYSITDPDYHGVRFIEPEKLYRIAKLVLSHDLQLTAHAVGDGATTALVDAYERVDREFSVRPLRPCVAHCNFVTADVLDRMQRLGVVADMQPAWLYLDGATLTTNFGSPRMAWFQPYRAILDRGVHVGGGSDHMQKIGRRRSINTYDPFLGMATMITRLPRGSAAPRQPEQCIGREDALRLYTIANAYLTFEEQEKGSLEPGKLADCIVIDRDFLTCPVEAIADTQVEQTYVGGQVVYAKP